MDHPETSLDPEIIREPETDRSPAAVWARQDWSARLDSAPLESQAPPDFGPPEQAHSAAVAPGDSGRTQSGRLN
jgi:hypothetical protein